MHLLVYIAVIESYCTERKIKKGDFIYTAAEPEVNKEATLHVTVIFVYYSRRYICSFIYSFLFIYIHIYKTPRKLGKPSRVS